jgi:two-component system, LytTR family, response regulator
MRETLGAIERRLDSTVFVRVHRSHLVNVTRMKHVRSLFHGEYELTLADGSRINTGRTYTHAVQRLMRG